MAFQGGNTPNTSALAAAWCGKLQQFCTELQKNCSALYAIVQRKSDSGSRDNNCDFFLEDLKDDVSSSMAELQHLEGMTTDTLSFEELLAHCTALYNWNEDGVSKLETQLQQYGYTPVANEPLQNKETSEEETHHANEMYSLALKSTTSPTKPESTMCSTKDIPEATPTRLSYESKDIVKDVEYSPLFGDLESLEDLGISATSLTALASQDAPGNGKGSAYPIQQKLFDESPAKDPKDLRGADMYDTLKMKYNSAWISETEKKVPAVPSFSIAVSGSSTVDDERHNAHVDSINSKNECLVGAIVSSKPSTVAATEDESVSSGGSSNLRMLDQVTSVEFDKTPNWLKLKVTLQELNDAVTKINEVIKQRSSRTYHTDPYVLDQEDFKSLGLGSISNQILQLLGKVNKLRTQFSNGVTTYRACGKLQALLELCMTTLPHQEGNEKCGVHVI